MSARKGVAKRAGTNAAGAPRIQRLAETKEIPSQEQPENTLPEQKVRVGKPVYGGSFELPLPGQAALPFVAEGESVRVQPQPAPHPPTLLQVVEASPNRVEPRCRHFGACGGCQYQHLSQAAQLRTKADLLQQMLGRAGVPTPVPAVHAAEPGQAWGYRNRVRLRLEDGRVGYSRRGLHEFLPIAECPILAPVLWRTAAAAQALPAGSWPQRCSEIELFTTGDEAAVQVALHLDANVATLDREAPEAFRTLCAALQAAEPAVVGGGLLVHAAADRTASRRVRERARVEVARWGSPGLVYRVQDRRYPVTRGAFFQVNRFLTGRLVDLVLGNRQGSLAMDLFAGAGLFSLALAECFDRVVSVEVGESAASDLARLMAGQRTVRQTTHDFLREWNRGAQVPDFVVADPPRAGIGGAALGELLRLRSPEIAYVSCDPVSFAREARALVDSGYAVAELHAVDLFPQTFHMETVAVFRRG